MSKRSLLIGSKSNLIETRDYNSNYFIIASGNDVIPLFWFSLYTNQDIYYFENLMNDGNTIKSPRMIIDFDTGFARLCQRQKQFIKLLPPKLVYLYDKWAFLIQDLDTNFIHVDINGLFFNIQEFKNYDIYVHQILSIVDNLAEKNALEIVKNFVGIEFKKTLFGKKIIAPESLHDITRLLCGSSWLNDKPWESYF